MNSIVALWLSLFVGIGAAACRKGDGTGDGTSDSDAQALANSGYAWPGARVEVCFLNDSNNPAAKNIVKRALDVNFTRSSTTIEFFGFSDCQPNSKAPAKILFGVERAFSGYIGKYKVPMNTQRGETVGLPVLDDQFYFYNTVIHEFGHFAGLFHEAHRLENRDDSLCKNDPKNNGIVNELPNMAPGLRPVAMGAFDRMSIMNYCVQGYMTQFLRLSDGDTKALRALYSKAIASAERTNANSPISQGQPASNDPAVMCNVMAILPREISNVSAGGYNTHTSDGSAVFAYKDESFLPANLAGTLPVGTVVSRLLTKPIYMEVMGSRGQNLTAMQVIPQSGPLQGAKVWILGNVTVVTDCRDK